MGVALTIRKVVRKIRLPCGATGGDLDDDHPTALHKNISNSKQKSVYAKEENLSSSLTEEETQSSSAIKSLCAICLEPLSCNNNCSSSSTGSSPGQAIFTAQCSHAFHFTCISSNVRHGSVTCPICRAHWSQLPRTLYTHSSSSSSSCSQQLLPNTCNNNQIQADDPILRILDESIATFRVHRRSSLRSARYDDDDPVEPPDHTMPSPNHPRLHLTLVPCTGHPHSNFSPLPCSHPSLQGTTTPSYHQYACELSTPPHHHFCSSFPVSPENTMSPSTRNNNPYHHLSFGNSHTTNRAYLSVKLAHQQPTDIVLVASPNGPHLRLLKQSMALVVFSLRSVDRLAIVTYSSAATRAFPLRRMTSHGKRTALQVIDRLFYMGEADPGAGLKKAIKILEDRIHKNPESCILHLSDSPTRSYIGHDIDVTTIPTPIHRFHVGFGFGTSYGFVMHEFEEFLTRLLGGVIRETQLMIGEDGGIARLGELRGGEERRIPLELGENGFVRVGYSYIEGGVEEYIRTGEIVVSTCEKRGLSDGGEAGGRRDMSIISAARTGSAESWNYHDPYMTRRWAKHLHGQRL